MITKEMKREKQKNIKDLQKINQNPDVICFMVYKNEIVISNPCRISIKMLKSAIRKSERMDKNGCCFFGSIKIPLPTKLLKKKKK